MVNSRLPRRIGAVLVLLAFTACGSASEGPRPDAVEEVRVAVEPYRDVETALADGYVPDVLDTCEAAAHMGLPPELGNMGIHYFRPDLLGVPEGGTRLDVTGTHTDFRQPAVLLYEPQADGSLELVAVANLVLAEAWEAAGHDEPPSFGGQPFDYIEADPSKVIEAHYDRHLWLFRENPTGISAPYNPDVTCEHHVVEMPYMGGARDMDSP